MKKWISVLLIAIFALTITGCGSKKMNPNPKPRSEDENHVVVDQKDFKIAVTDVPKNLKNLVQATEPGREVISINVTITNHKKEPLHVNPNFVKIITDKGNTYQWYEADAVILGKSVFRDFDVPGNDGKGGGKLTFEILPGETVEKLIYADDSGHTVNLTFPKTASKI